MPNGGSVANGTLGQLIAFGKYNSVTLPGDTAYNGTKYQARAGFTSNVNIYWFNLDAPGSPSRSVGWHKFTMERLASGSAINFYVDGILSRAITDVAVESFDSLVLGFGAGSTVGDGWIDGVEVSSGAPTITTQPLAATAAAGGNVSFRVADVGGITYQWTHAGTNILGANSTTLNLSGVTADNAGDYTVIVGNSAGDTTSSTVTLDVTVPKNIVFVSDNGPAGFSGPTAGTVDDSFVTLLQNAGHSVIRFNSDNSAAVLLTQAEMDALNTNDLIIVGRAAGSAAFGGAQGAQWNTLITKPLMVQSVFLTRSNLLGWFVGTDANNRVPMPLTAVTPTDPENAYLFDLFGTPAMNGATTVGNFDEVNGQGTSHTFNDPVAGGNILATGNGTNKVIVEFPPGTPVRTGTHVLGGYRMFFASGNREPTGGTVPQAGADNLTAIGEAIFLRAVNLAIHNGVAPNLGEPPVITSQPSGTNACTGLPITLSATATGENPLSYQWFHSDGATFTNLVTSGTNSVLTIASFQATDAGFYAVLVANAVGSVTSSVVAVT
ncbi:MAG TPA: immunoglobulin domain-containing protein, partial [Methylomirabilota bacterium]|nr:immunoglobulin domain-containing protein [Methylomirabilota bacterium]